MANEWSNRLDRTEDSDKHTAATLAAALITRGFTLPAATSSTMAAAQAVDLYRSVLANLRGLEDAGAPVHASLLTHEDSRMRTRAEATLVP